MIKLDMNASAVLVWLPKGETPTADSFDPTEVQPPPYPNPSPWWLLEEAIIFAREVDDQTHGKMPWIKTGDTVLGPDQIIHAYSGIRATKAFDAPGG